MGATKTYSVRMDPEIKTQLDRFCDQVGITTSAAINLFAFNVVQEQRLPFEVKTYAISKEELLERAKDFDTDQNISMHDLIEE